MRTLLLLLILCCTSSLLAQDRLKTYHLKEVGMTLKLPEKYRSLDSAENAEAMEGGKRALEKTLDQEVDVSATRDLLSVQSTPTDYINITITSLTPEERNEWAKAHVQVCQAIHQTLREMSPEARLDSVSSRIVIDGVAFERFAVRVRMGENVELNMVLLARLYKGYDFGIAYLYSSEGSRREMEEMIRTARLSK